MKVISVTDVELRDAYKTATDSGKEMLMNLFGEKVDLYDHITFRVRTFSDACEVLDISSDLPDVKNLPLRHRKAIIANYKLIIIAEALNEGWRPNWQDPDEYKYYPWFSMAKSTEVDPSNAYATATIAHANFGSRLCFKNCELAIHFGQEFADLHNESMLF